MFGGGDISSALAQMRQRLGGGGAPGGTTAGPGPGTMGELPMTAQFPQGPSPMQPRPQGPQGLGGVQYQNGQPGIVGRGGNFQPLGAAAQGRLPPQAMSAPGHMNPQLSAPMPGGNMSTPGAPAMAQQLAQLGMPGAPHLAQPPGGAPPMPMSTPGRMAPQYGGSGGIMAPGQVPPMTPGAGGYPPSGPGSMRSYLPQPAAPIARINSARNVMSQGVRGASAPAPSAPKEPGGGPTGGNVSAQPARPQQKPQQKPQAQSDKKMRPPKPKPRY